MASPPIKEVAFSFGTDAMACSSALATVHRHIDGEGLEHGMLLERNDQHKIRRHKLWAVGKSSEWEVKPIVV